MEKQKKVNRFLTLILAMVVSVLCLGIMGAALRANTYQAYAKQVVGAAALLFHKGILDFGTEREKTAGRKWSAIFRFCLPSPCWQLSSGR